MRTKGKIGLLLALACGGMLAGCGGGTKDSTKPGTQEVPKAAPAADASKAPLVPKVQLANWCPEHGVPESLCSRCNASLIADFKAKGDWCEKHGLPNSQCVACKPELKEQLEQLKPKTD